MKLLFHRKSLMIGFASPRLTMFVIVRSAVDGRPAIGYTHYVGRGRPTRVRVLRPFGGRK